jgi:hypothetical protein
VLKLDELIDAESKEKVRQFFAAKPIDGSIKPPKFTDAIFEHLQIELSEAEIEEIDNLEDSQQSDSEQT